MDFLKILKALEEINRLNQIEANKAICQHKRDALISQVQDAYKKEGANYLNQILVHLGLIQASDKNNNIQHSAPAHLLKNYDVNTQLYQQLLPLCQLAYLHEKNGHAKEHACKLSIIFDTYQNAFNYLLKFSKLPHRYLLHDSCLFDLPTVKSPHFRQWKLLAVSHLDNSHFRKLLPHILELEKIARLSKSGKQWLEQDRNEIQTLKKKIEQCAAAYKKLARHALIHPSAEQRRQRDEALKRLSKEQATLRVAFAKIRRGLSISELDLFTLESFYEYLLTDQEAHRILIQHGIGANEREQFTLLARMNDDEAIPNVLIDGSIIGYKNYYLKKLDILSDKGAAIAACLGKITNCCQYLGGLGTDCAIHGISSPNGGFYLVCEGDSQHPDFDDRILSQAWAWRGHNGELCFDSIETTIKEKSDEKTITVAFFRFLGHLLCRDYGINYVNTGSQSGITNQIAFKDYPAPKVHYLDYHGYSDSKSQLLLAAKTMPYLFFGKGSALFQQQIRNDINTFFSTLFEQDKPLKNNEALKQILAFISYTKNEELFHVLASFTLHRQEEFRRLVDMNASYFNTLNQGIISWEHLNQGVWPNALNIKGQSALHLAVLAGNTKAISKLLALNINVNIQDRYGNTALIAALEILLYQNNKEQGREIVALLIKAGAEVDIKDKNEQTPLHIAVKNKDLKMVDYLISQGADIETFDDDMKTAFFWAVELGDEPIFNYLLEKGAKINGISYSSGKNLLMVALQANKPEIIDKLLEKKEFDIKHTTKRGQNILHFAADTPRYFKKIFERCPEILKLHLLNQEDLAHNTPLYFAAKHVEPLTLILSYYPEQLRQDALGKRNKEGDTILHPALDNPDCLKLALGYLNEKQLVKMLFEYNTHWNNVYLSSLKNPESLKIILNSLSTNQLLDKLHSQLIGTSVLTRAAADNAQSLQIILNLYPENERKSALERFDNYGFSSLHRSSRNIESIKFILGHYPQDEHLNRLKVKAKDGRSILDFFDENSPEAFHYILSYYPEDQRLSALATNLHDVAQYSPKCLKIAFELLPESQRLDAVLLEQDLKFSLIQICASRPEQLKIIWQFLTDQQRLEAIKYKNKDCLLEPALFLMARTPESLKIMLPLFAKKELLNALKANYGFKNCMLVSILNNPECLRIILETLPEQDRLEFLRFKSISNFSLNEKCVMNEIIYNLPLPHIEHSFTRCYLEIVSYLSASSSHSIQRGLFFSNSENSKLMQTIEQAKTFEDILKAVLHFITEANPNNEVVRKLRDLLDNFSHTDALQSSNNSFNNS